MTVDSGAEQSEVQAAPSKSDAIHLEPLNQDRQTLHWDDILESLRASLSENELLVANAAVDIRAGRMLVWAVWEPVDGDNSVRALVFTRFVVDGLDGIPAMLIYGLRTHGLSEDQWIAVDRELSDACQRIGIQKMIAVTDSKRLGDTARLNGWNTRIYCEKELSNG